jgi:hypothetical protein
VAVVSRFGRAPLTVAALVLAVLLSGVGYLVYGYAVGIRDDIGTVRTRMDRQVALSADMKHEMSTMLDLMRSQLHVIRRQLKVTRRMHAEMRGMATDTAAMRRQVRRMQRLALQMRYLVEQINRKMPESARLVP